MKKLGLSALTLTITACSSTSQIDESKENIAQKNGQFQTASGGVDSSSAVTTHALRERDDFTMISGKDFSEKTSTPLTVYFDFDKSQLRAETIEIIQKHAEFLVKNNLKVTLEGHTDRRGTQEYNIALGEKRAQSVETFLMNFGVEPERINVVSYGEEKPAVLTNNEEGYKENRRVFFNYDYN